MDKIVIMAGGPPHIRHLRKVQIRGQGSKLVQECRVIDLSIRAALNSKSKPSVEVLISRDNVELLNYVRERYEELIVLTPDGNDMLDSFRCALFPPTYNRAILVCGDLINIRPSDIDKFVDSNCRSAISKYMTPWGRDLKSKRGNYMKRGDMGDAVFMVASEHAVDFLSPVSIDKARYYFSQFHPNSDRDDTKANHLWTWLTYAFFYPLMGTELPTATSEINYISHERRIYLDVDG